jgi:hypothetical protein
MNRLLGLKIGLALATILACGAAARSETYTKVPNTNCLTPKNCVTVGYSPKGWKCHWSMDIKGKELKSIPVTGPGGGDATDCSVNECTAACSKTAGCIAVDITKGAASNNRCICTLFSSVTSATFFEEIRTGETLSGKACIRLPKRQPPITENPDFPGVGRPGVERDQFRPDTPGTTGTPGRRRP